MWISALKHMPEPVRRVEIFTDAGRRRNWSPEEKAAIVTESYGEGASVCAVARRHGLMPQQLFTWRRQEIIADRPTTAFLETHASRTPVTRRLDGFEAPLSNRAAQEVLGIREEYSCVGAYRGPNGLSKT